MAAVRYQLVRLSRRRRTAPNLSPLWALVTSQISAKRSTRQYRRWMAQRPDRREAVLLPNAGGVLRCLSG